MYDYIVSFVAVVIACFVLVAVSVLLARLQFLYDIRRYNKTHQDHQLEERTPLKTFQVRQRDWLLEMFCDEKKGNNENEK